MPATANDITTAAAVVAAGVGGRGNGRRVAAAAAATASVAAGVTDLTSSCSCSRQHVDTHVLLLLLMMTMAVMGSGTAALFAHVPAAGTTGVMYEMLKGHDCRLCLTIGRYTLIPQPLHGARTVRTGSATEPDRC
jgi:hypothetical protein